MIATSLLNILAQASGGDTSPSFIATIITQIDWALEDWERLGVVNVWFGATRFADTTVRLDARRTVYSLYQQWAHDAEALLSYAARLKKNGHAFPRREELADAYGRAQARLKLTPDSVEKAIADVMAGLGISLEDLQNELRSNVRA